MSGYNGLGVITVAVARDYVKALIDRLTDEQVEALRVIVESMTWPEVGTSPADETAIDEGLADLAAGRKVSAEDAWGELGL